MADDWDTAVDLLRTATRLVDGIQEGLAARGFDDVRPAHGFAFARISGQRATTADLADHLGITKQAASQLVDQLVGNGYVTRTDDPQDRRARLLLLTERGHACTGAAQQAAVETVRSWQGDLPAGQFRALQSTLHVIAGQGRLRPAW